MAAVVGGMVETEPDARMRVTLGEPPTEIQPDARDPRRGGAAGALLTAAGGRNFRASASFPPACGHNPRQPMSFTFRRLDIPDLVLVHPTRHTDSRGFFMETYRATPFAEAGITGPFVQDNMARSGAGVLRGLHYQLPPRAQGKLVQVLRGRIFDVAVDLRRDAPTFGRWVGHTLADTAGDILWVPPGFAHGYVVLSDGADVAYKVTAEYEPTLDRGIRWDDPRVGVEWPVEHPSLSTKDRALPLLSDADNPFTS